LAPLRTTTDCTRHGQRQKFSVFKSTSYAIPSSARLTLASLARDNPHPPGRSGRSPVRVIAPLASTARCRVAKGHAMTDRDFDLLLAQTRARLDKLTRPVFEREVV